MKRIEQLIPLVKPYYPEGDPAHDWAHIGRVSANAKFLCGFHPVDQVVTLAAVYDLINLPKNHPDRALASTLAAKEAEALLLKAGFNAKEVEKIQNTIIEHSFSKGLKPSTLEAAIVQDADRLDALGAIGVLRCAAVNTLMKTSFYDPYDPLAENRQLNDKAFMLDHYFVKLFKLPELMNTQEAKAEAEKRVLYMQHFLNTLMGEIRQLEK